MNETLNTNDTSILVSVKKRLGIPDESKDFDDDITMDINSVFSILNDLSVGPKDGFYITGKNEKWSSLIGSYSNLELVKSYVYLKVRLIFDPPQSSAVIESMNRMISEFEWRICHTADVMNKENNHE